LVSSYNLRNPEKKIRTIIRYACTASIAEPISYNEAINCMHVDKWKQAIIEEID